MLTAIMTCGLTAVMLSACSSDDDNNAEAPQEQADVQMMYAVEVTDDVLKVRCGGELRRPDGRQAERGDDLDNVEEDAQRQDSAPD